jgi:hypothetical protein
MRYSPMKLGAGMLAALVVTLGACSDSSSPSTSSDVLTQSQAAEISADAAGDVDELADFSNFDPSTGMVMTAPGSMPRVPVAPGCVSISPDPLVNSDGDAVPDSARFDYNDCVFVRGNGTVTDSLRGTIDFLDPLPLVAVQNGTREWGGNADTLGHTITGFSTVWTHPSGRTTTHTKDWVAKFTATTPGSIALLTPLPAGAFTVAGTGTWTTLGRSWSVVTSTVTPMLYDPTCLVAPRFTAGRLDLAVTRNGEVTNVTIDFTACGQYTVTRTPGATP